MNFTQTSLYEPFHSVCLKSYVEHINYEGLTLTAITASEKHICK